MLTNQYKNKPVFSSKLNFFIATEVARLQGWYEWSLPGIHDLCNFLLLSAGLIYWFIYNKQNKTEVTQN